MASAVIRTGRLRRELMLRGWDAVDLARAASISPATLSNAFAGRPVSATTLRKIAVALGRKSVVRGAEDLLAPD